MYNTVAGLLLVLLAAHAVASGPDLERLFRHAEFVDMALSPDGRHLAATVPEDDQRGVVVLDITNPSTPRVTTGFRMPANEFAVNLRWVNNERLIFTSHRQFGSLAMPMNTGRVYGVNADGSNRRQVYGPRDNSMVLRFMRIVHRLPEDDRRVLIVETAHDREQPMAWLLDVYQQDRVRRVARSPLRRGSLAPDRDGAIRFAHGVDEDWNQQFAWRPDGDSDWITFENPFGADIEFSGFDADGVHIYVRSRDRETLGVWRINLETEAREQLLVDDTFEAISGIRDAAGDTVIGAIFATPVPEARFFDPEHPTARVWRSLRAALPDYHVRIFNFTDDGGQALVFLHSDREPGVFMRLDVESMALEELAAARRWIRPEHKAAMQPIHFTARDGLELHGYLTLPPDSDGKDLPMIVEVHGGPHGPYDQWMFQPVVQTWALNGYAVLQINFRGSGGRGYQFERGAFRQWGAEMQDDLTDGTRWAIAQGIAHPDRVCISGGSYGGYATLMGLVREPELYRCGFAFVGVYDLNLMKEEGNIASYEMGRRYLDQALGSDEAVLRERSPVTHVENIKADLFVAHGAEDRQAHFGQYHALIRRLDEAGIPHQKLWVEKEGHGFFMVENNVKLFGQALAFFDRNIGSGWREPVVSPDPADQGAAE